MKKVFSLIASMLLSVASFAQVAFEQGWIKDNEGNKTECLVRNTENFLNATSIKYKLTSDAKETTASISDISAFYVGGNLFERFTIELDMSSDEAGSYSHTPDPENKLHTIFMEVLCDGDIKLYHHTLRGVKENFFIAANGSTEPTYLIHKKYLDEATYRVKENNYFRQQLFMALMNKGVSESDIRYVPYEEGALIALINKSNKKNESASKKEASITTTRRKGQINIDLEAMCWPSRLAALSGAMVDLEYIIPSNKNKWSVFATGGIEFRPDAKHISAQFGAGARYYMYLHKDVSMYLDAALLFSRPNNFNLGLGFKFWNVAAVGFRYNDSIDLFFPDGKATRRTLMNTSDKLWPVSVYVKFSIPVTRLANGK